ncbi:alpha/beta hydrolase [Sessilibacter sp. MAH4]
MCRLGTVMKKCIDIDYTSNDGLKLYARDYNVSARQTIICIPGLTRNSKDYLDFCDYFSTEYRVIAVDLRGRGKSQYDDNVINYNPLTYAQDILQLIHYLNINDVILVGTSLGGLVSMILSNLAPGLIKGIVLNDIGPEINPIGVDRIKSYVGKASVFHSWADAVASVRSVHGSELPGMTDAQWLSFTKGLMNESESGEITFAYDIKIAQWISDKDDSPKQADLWPQFDNMLDVPLLVIRGAHSDILDIQCVNKMRNKHHCMQYCEIKQRGHTPMLNELESIAALDDFFRDLCFQSTLSKAL